MTWSALCPRNPFLALVWRMAGDRVQVAETLSLPRGIVIILLLLYVTLP